MTNSIRTLWLGVGMGILAAWACAPNGPDDVIPSANAQGASSCTSWEVAGFDVFSGEDTDWSGQKVVQPIDPDWEPLGATNIPGKSRPWVFARRCAD